MATPRLTMLLALATLVGCQAMLESEMRSRSAPYIDCPTGDIHITHAVLGVAGVSPTTWDADGCQRRYLCTHWKPTDEMDVERVDCKQVAISPDDERRQQAIDALAAKTRCNANLVSVDSARPGSLPGERDFLMNACGARYECRTDGANTDCVPVVAR